MTIGSQSLINNRYVLMELLGSGGMGSVYRASDRLNGQVVALKRVSVETSALVFGLHPERVDLRLALAREFQTLASLRHPNIISVLDYGFAMDGQPYFTMPLLEGAVDVREAAERFDLRGRVGLIAQMLEALRYLHRQGIIHRDLKPGNVLVTPDGVLRLLDFGLAIESEKAIGVAGTLAYLAPEILHGHRPVIPTDLYAVGVMSYELLAGRYPFETGTPQVMMRQIIAMLPDLTPIPEGLDPDAPRLYTGGSAHSEGITIILPDSSTHAGSLPLDEETKTFVAAEVPKTADLISATRPIIPLAEVSGTPPEGQRKPTTPPSHLRAFVGRLLAKVPEDRYGDAGDALHDLAALTGLPELAENANARESFLAAAKFVGRQRPLGALQTALNAAIRGEGSAWLVGGESGVGKSRLIDEIRGMALVNGALVLTGQAVDNGGLAYQIWRDPVRRLLLSTEVNDLDAGTLKSIIPDIAALLDRPIPDAPALDGRSAEQRLAVTILDLFRRYARPILLIAEDLQWVTESLDPLKLMIKTVGDLPLMIIGSYRDDERPELPAELPEMRLLTLERFDTAQIVAFSQSMLGEAGTQPRLINLLEHETEGNALFMVEVVRALAEEAGSLGAIGRATLPDHVLSGGIKSILLRRIARVPLIAQPLLRLAAAGGRFVDLNVIAHLDPTLNVEGWLAACVNAAVLEVNDGRWRFAHEKLRMTLLETMDSAEYAQANRRIGVAIENIYAGDDAYAPLLMDHWKAAGERDKEAHYATLTGEQLALRSLFSEARKLFTRALALLPPTDHARRVEALVALGETAERTSDYPEAQMRFMEALESGAATPALEVRAHNGLSAVAHRRGDYERGEAQARAALSLAQKAGDRRGIAASFSNLGNIAYARADYSNAARHYEDSLFISRELADRAGIAAALTSLANVAYARGDYPLARARYSETFDIWHEIGNRLGMNIILNNLGAVASALGDYQNARQHYERSLTLQNEIHDRRGISFSLNNLGTIAYRTGDYPRAAQYYEESLNIKREIGDRKGAASSLNNLGFVAYDLGDYNRAKAYYAECLSIGREIGDRRAIANGLDGLGITAAAQNNHAAAETHFSESLALFREMGDRAGAATTLINRGFSRLQAGDLPGAGDSGWEAVSLAQEIGASGIVVDALMLFAQLNLMRGAPGDGERAAVLLGAAEVHPAFSGGQKRRFTTLWAEFEENYPEEARPAPIQAALIRGKTLTSDEAIQTLVSQR
ncbi:MAG TPA: tetratricopeptide repeat protein [Aggregatilineales bacterium]|nr:tetratricopeptide repeat protein [Anaerolineales bacterium]HRE48571.1 tetratricopeptide repeat protein [Aggregatilineales bacterium]